MNDIYNKKLLEKGGPTSRVTGNELPIEAAKYVDSRGNFK